MAWIRTIANNEAGGLLARMFQAAEKRAGRVFNIVRVQSLNPRVLQASSGVYQTIMFGESPLSRAQRELLAIVVSKANACHY